MRTPETDREASEGEGDRRPGSLSEIIFRAAFHKCEKAQICCETCNTAEADAYRSLAPPSATCSATKPW